MEWLFVIWVIFVHWVADFVCQTHYMGVNKSKSNKVLLSHIIVYTSVMMILVAPFLPFIKLLIFGAITFAAHFATDYVTSRKTSKLYARGDYHNFFVVIGFDQFLHYTQLLLTLWLLK